MCTHMHTQVYFVPPSSLKAQSHSGRKETQKNNYSWDISGTEAEHSFPDFAGPEYCLQTG